MSKSLSFSAIAILFAVAAAAQGQNAYTSFGPGESYNPTSGWTITAPGSSISFSQACAAEFTSAATGNLVNVTLACQNVSGTDALDVSLYSDNSGSLGGLIESWSPTGEPTFGTGAPPTVLGSVTNAPIVAGDNYWVVVLPGGNDTWAAWNFSNSTYGNLLFSADGGNTWNPQNNIDPAFSVEVTPEPKPFLVLGLGLLPLILRRKRAA